MIKKEGEKMVKDHEEKDIPTVIVISGLSGTGKSYLLEEIIKKGALNCERVKKYTTRQKRQGEEENCDVFGMTGKEIREKTEIFYLQNENLYGIDVKGIKDILKKEKNAVFIGTGRDCSIGIRDYCIENNIPCFKVYLEDSNLNKDNVYEMLDIKGRSEQEIATRKKTQEAVMDMILANEGIMCDMVLKNSCDPKTKEWDKGADELIKEIKEGIAKIRKKENKIFKYLNKFLENGNMEEYLKECLQLKKIFLKARWQIYGSNTASVEKYISKYVKAKEEMDIKCARIINIERECEMMRIIDGLAIKEVREKIVHIRNDAASNGAKTLDTRNALQNEYEGVWKEIKDNQARKNFYKENIQLELLMEGETIDDRLDFLIQINKGFYDRMLSKVWVEIVEPYAYDL